MIVSPLTESQTMDNPTAKDVVLNAWKTFSTRDAGQIASLFTPDAEWIAPARNATAVALAHTDHMIGPDQIARFIASEIHRLFSGIDISFRAIHADGDTVIIEGRLGVTLPEGGGLEKNTAFSLSAQAAGSSRFRNTWTRQKAGQ